MSLCALIGQCVFEPVNIIALGIVEAEVCSPALGTRQCAMNGSFGAIEQEAKLKGFNRGVTVTGGLSTVFTTPAHGTAFDIVGKGCANTGALEQAVRLAARLSMARRRAGAAPVPVPGTA